MKREQEAIAQEEELKMSQEPSEVVFEVGMRIGEHIKSPIKPNMFQIVRELNKPKMGVAPS